MNRGVGARKEGQAFYSRGMAHAMADRNGGTWRDREYAVGVYLGVGVHWSQGGAEALPIGHRVILPGANHRLRISTRSISISAFAKL